MEFFGFGTQGFAAGAWWTVVGRDGRDVRCSAAPVFKASLLVSPK